MTVRNRSLTPAIALIIICIATLVTYGRVIRFDFTSWDDYETVARNPKLNPPTTHSLRDFWTRPQMDLYVPVTYSVWALTASVSQNPGAFHALNLLLHAAAACVAFLLLNQLIHDTSAALLGACLFALHPVQVESVAWVSGAKDVLCGLLSLLAVWQYVVFAQTNRKRAIAVATLAFILAILAKPTAIVVPLLAAIIDLLILHRPLTKVAAIITLWLVLTIPAIIWTKLAQPALHAHEFAAPWRRPIIALDALTFYLWKIIWPAHLGIDYGRSPDVVVARHWFYWTWIVPVSVAVLLWLRRRNAVLIVAALLFVTALLPLLGLVPFDFQAYSTVADHYLYLAMIGPALALAWLLHQRPNPALRTTFILVLAVLAIRTMLQTSAWQNSQALFHHALEVNPRSYVSYNSLAAAAIEARDPDLAADLSRRSVELNPTYAAGYLTHASAMRQMGDFPAALRACQQALQYEPNYVPALNNLAALYAEQGQLDQAVATAHRAIAADSASVTAHLNLGRMYVQLQQWDLAQQEFQTVLRLDPENQAARQLLTEIGNP